MMDVYRLGQNLIKLGFAGMAISVTWWGWFWYSVHSPDGYGLEILLDPEVIACFYNTGGGCGFAYYVVDFGFPSYTPYALYLSVAIVIVGLVVRNSANN